MRKTESHPATGWIRVRKAIILCVSATILASCGSLPQIGTDVAYCSNVSLERISTYRVEFEDTPEFLKPMLRDEASVTLSTKGLEYVEGDAHAILMMTYVNRTLESGEAAQDEAWETIAPGGGVRFIAEVKLEMKDAVSHEMIWAGSMARVHNVYEGSYMHEAPARAAMRNAFLEMFADFPDSYGDACN